MTEEEAGQVLASAVGRVIVRINRIFYVFQGVTNKAVGAVDLEFQDGSRIVVDSGSDGESISVQPGPWVDPFLEGDISQENRDYIAKSGKWTSFDVSRDLGYADLVGAVIEAVDPVLTPSGKMVGLVMRTSGGHIRADVEADDIFIQTD
jgi:hypothetical protein